MPLNREMRARREREREARNKARRAAARWSALAVLALTLYLWNL